MPKSNRTTPRTIKKRANTATAATAKSSNAAANSPLPSIQCVVVLMLENRSFDHLFGKWPGVSGLAQGPFSNRPNPAAPANAAGNPAIAAGQPAALPHMAFDATRAAPDDVMSEMARHWRTRTGGLPGAPSAVATPTSQDEVHQFLRTQIQA